MTELNMVAFIVLMLMVVDLEEHVMVMTVVTIVLTPIVVQKPVIKLKGMNNQNVVMV